MRAPRHLTLLVLVVGCAAEHVSMDASGDGAARPEAAVVDAARTDAAFTDAGAIDTGAIDAGPRPDADTVVHSRCASPPSTRSLVVGLGYACRIDETGQLWCWGENDWGQVRPGADTWVEPHEVAYEGLSDVLHYATSGQHACVVHRDGGVSCWGWNGAGEVGGTPAATHTTRPVRVAGVSDVDRVSLTGGLTCARTRDTRWWCWGGAGYLGAAFGATGTPPPGPFELPLLRGAHQLALGYTNAAALFEDGHVEAISVPDSRIAHRYTLAGIDPAIDVVAVDSYVCAIGRTGRVWCAGSQSVAIDPPPELVGGIDDARAFARTYPFLEVCAVRGDGSLWCWTMARMPLLPPWQVPGAADVDLAATGADVCISTCSGELRCNGRGWRGENGDDASRVPPTEIAGLDDATAIDGSCALRTDGTVSCWDQTRLALYGEACPATPAPLEPQTGLERVVRLEDGAAIRDDGTIACTGSSARELNGLPTAAIDATCESTLALAVTTDGRLFAWTSPDSSAPPVLVATPAPVAELMRTAVRTTDGRVLDVVCESFFGTVCRVGVAWPGVTDADAVWTGDRVAWGPTGASHDCVRQVGGRVDCRFAGTARTILPPLLGIATPDEQVLVHVPALDGATRIVPDGENLCASDAAGAVRCWGEGRGGRLGSNDTTVHQTQPVASDTIDLAGGLSTCALGASGHVTCWGLVLGGWGSGAICPRPTDRIVRSP